MKAMSLSEVYDVMHSASFSAWYEKCCALHKKLEQTTDDIIAVQLHQGLLQNEEEVYHKKADDLIFLAAEYDNEAAVNLARFSSIENESFEALSQYEQQRNTARQFWNTMGAKENELEEKRQLLNERTAAAQVTGAQHVDFSEGEMKRLQDDIQRLQRDCEDSRRHLKQHEILRDNLWKSVESSWSESFECNMAHSEYLYKARKARSCAEEYYARTQQAREPAPPPSPSEPRHSLQTLEEKQASLKAQLAKLRAQAREQFHAVLIDEFLFWPRKDDNRFVYCLPLIEDNHHLNIQVQPLNVYQIERARGLDFIEPAIAMDLNDDDSKRLEDFFTRPGQSTT